MERLLRLAAPVGAVTGLALMIIAPSVVARLLWGDDAFGRGSFAKNLFA